MKTGIVGWRGMVGSVLMERMRAERDFALIDPVFFSTSQAGGAAPDVGRGAGVLRDVLAQQQDYRGALTLDWYAGNERSQRALIEHVPAIDRARTLLSWADRAAGSERGDAGKAKV